MTAEEMKALLDASLGAIQTQLSAKFDELRIEQDTKLQGLQGDLLKKVDEKNSGLASYISKKFDKPGDAAPSAEDADTKETKLTLKSLQTKLADLETARTKDLQVIAQNKRDNFIKDQLVKQGANSAHIGSAQKLFLASVGEVQEEDGVFYTKQGDKVSLLEDTLTSYLGSDEGKLFLPPASKVKGSHLRETAKVPNVGSEKTLNELLFTPDEE